MKREHEAVPEEGGVLLCIKRGLRFNFSTRKTANVPVLLWGGAAPYVDRLSSVKSTTVLQTPIACVLHRLLGPLVRSGLSSAPTLGLMGRVSPLPRCLVAGCRSLLFLAIRIGLDALWYSVVSHDPLRCRIHWNPQGAFNSFREIIPPTERPSLFVALE